MMAKIALRRRPMSHVSAAACRKLWRAVILDQLRMATRHTMTHVITDFDIADARRWFSSRDFEMICDLADVCPHRVRKYVRGEINRGDGGRGRYRNICVRGTVYVDVSAAAAALGVSTAHVRRAVRQDRTDILGLGSGPRHVQKGAA